MFGSVRIQVDRVFRRRLDCIDELPPPEPTSSTEAGCSAEKRSLSAQSTPFADKSHDW
jgi:hypothetical protein